LTDRIFVEASAFRGGWVANRPDERLYRMIKGFQEAGDLLIAESEADNRRALNLIYPAVFAYRQSLELRLKELLLEFGPVAGEKPDFRSHDLKALWSKCKRVAAFFESSLQPKDREAFDAAEMLIVQFDAIDPGSDAFRFAHDTKGRSVKLSVTEIDLANLRRVMAGLHNFLDGVASHFHHLIQSATS
jgi:hypothetical protein